MQHLTQVSSSTPNQSPFVSVTGATSESATKHFRVTNRRRFTCWNAAISFGTLIHVEIFKLYVYGRNGITTLVRSKTRRSYDNIPRRLNNASAPKTTPSCFPIGAAFPVYGPQLTRQWNFSPHTKRQYWGVQLSSLTGVLTQFS